ncbi:MAG: hypothetical protein KGH75_01480 [Rhodospirillales bacterium]|nr:hypothetical protein [Rhodospirillales bacterium]
MKVYLVEGLIGDSISCLEFLKHIRNTYGSVEFGPGFNKWVFDGLQLDKSYTFNENLTKEEADFCISCSNSWQWCYSKQRCHMSEGHFYYNNITPPSLPYSFPFLQNECNLDKGIVFAPFSRTDDNGSKFWNLNNWLALAKNLPKPIYVLGSSTHDDMSILDNQEGVIKLFDQDCKSVVSLLKSCKMLVSIDTGISHLAHYLGMKNHVLLYPIVSMQKFANNPNTVYEVYDWPKNVSVDRMLEMCNKALNFGEQNE